MLIVGTFVTEVSRQLNDQYLGREFQRWNRAQLLFYLNGARAELMAHKPEAMAAKQEITLVTGSQQKLPDGAKLVSVDSNADGSTVTPADINLMKAFSQYTCCAGEVTFDKWGNPDYRVKSFAVDPKDTDTFYVSPAVPVGLTVKANATVTPVPTELTLADWGKEINIDYKYRENVMDYMMGRAFDIDTESPLSRSNADKHLSRFYTAMGVKYRVESAYRAGNYNGAVGSGDPRARLV